MVGLKIRLEGTGSSFVYFLWFWIKFWIVIRLRVQDYHKDGLLCVSIYSLFGCDAFVVVILMIMMLRSVMQLSPHTFLLPISLLSPH